MEKIGLIPAAGIARRLGSLPFSKEILPISFSKSEVKPSIKAITTHLLEKLQRTGVNKVYVIIRKGKWDILNYYGDGSEIGIRLAYLLMNHPYGVPYTLDQAYPFVKKSKIFLGFPDLLFEPEDSFALAEGILEKENADLVLGLFPVKDKRQMNQSDMVQFEPNGRITKIVVKPESSNLKFSWVFAIWNPDFTNFMHDFLQHDLSKREKKEIQTEIHIGHVIQAAVERGFAVFGHLFSNFSFIDVGHPENFALALKKYLIDKK
jgi:glucose-1-phosphate thymidylyltransferase